MAKGSDVGAFVGRPPQLIRFYHPRKDSWAEHFSLQGVRIVPRTEIGEATVRLFDLNGSDRLLLRRALAKARRYPSVEARAYLRE